MSEPALVPLTTVDSALRRARQQGVDRLDVQVMLCTLLNQPRAWLLAHDQDVLPADLAQRLTQWLQRRAEGEPLAYLLGDKEFHGLALHVTPDVLIPRPDTETLVDWALELIPAEPEGGAPFEVLDLGTGSGAIALALQHRRPHSKVTAVDASAAALAVAQGNATRLGLPVHTLLGSWFDAVPGRHFDLLVSNPPYIAERDPHLDALGFEPRQALTSGSDGLNDLRQIIARAPAHLRPNGWLLLEHGWDQAADVARLLRQRGFTDIASRQDLSGQSRCTGGKTPRAPTA